MSSSAVAKKQPQQVSKNEPQYISEEKETSASASGSAGLNLNIFGAVAGSFSNKSSKKTEDDGSSVERKEDQAKIMGKGAGRGHGGAAAAGAAGNAHAKEAIADGKA